MRLAPFYAVALLRTTHHCSGLYDYAQRSIWATNEAFWAFERRSPLASALAQLGETSEVSGVVVCGGDCTGGR